MFSRRRSDSSSTRGQALVETALILPILVLLLLLAIDLGRVFVSSIEMRNAAHEATMFGGTEPEAVCDEVRPVVDTEMNPPSPGESAVCGALGVDTGRVYITLSRCEESGAPCDPSVPFPASSDVRYHVQLQYRFQPIVPFVGLLTGNGVGGSVVISADNQSPVLVNYAGS